MPHDLNGKQLHAGDEVIVRFKVKAVHAESEYCNVDLESIHPMPGNGFPITLSAINTKQTEKVEG